MKWVFPLLEEKGFQQVTRRNPLFFEFRKSTRDEIWIVAIQWEKHGQPRFVVNFEKFPRAGIRWNDTNYSGEELDSSFAHCRLQPRDGTSTCNWFRQDRPLLERILSGSRLRPPEEVVEELISMLGEVFDYLEKGDIGNHVRTESRLTWTLQTDA